MGKTLARYLKKLHLCETGQWHVLQLYATTSIPKLAFRLANLAHNGNQRTVPYAS